MHLILLTVALQLVAGIAAFACGRRPRLTTACGAGLGAAASLLGIIPAWRALLDPVPQSLQMTWDGLHGSFCVGMDPLSAFFLMPVLILSALAAIYGASYLMPFQREKNLGASWLAFNLFTAGMIMVLLARTTLLFLTAWEVMSLSAFALVTFHHEKAEVRRAGWVYLVATHIGVAFLFLAFLLLGRGGAGDFASFQAAPGWTAGVILILALVGFGAKAGLVPFHVWLPEAHPAAPSHVSALMSGVMIKMGLYGLLRVLLFLGPPQAWWGLTLAGFGAVTALLGIALATQQRELKRVLAYSSIENMGLIVLAFGLGLWGRARGWPAVEGLGIASALLHIWNHSMIKGWMFLAAGSVGHGAGTQDLEQLGGLMPRMPWTGVALATGATAIAALPPLNGFAGKWLLYLGLLNAGLVTTGLRSLGALAAIGLLAHVGALAGLAFARMVGVALSGAPRSARAAAAHESSAWLLVPIYLLMAASLASAVAPTLLTAPCAAVFGMLLDPATASAAHTAGLAVLPGLGRFNAGVLIVGAGVALWLVRRMHRLGSCAQPVWGCGYLRPSARIQYTALSFGQMAGAQMLPRWMRSRIRRRSPEGLFPEPGLLTAAIADPVSRRAFDPFFRRMADRCMRLRVLQQGKVHVYITYILAMLILTLAWLTLRRLGGLP